MSKEYFQDVQDISDYKKNIKENQEKVSSIIKELVLLSESAGRYKEKISFLKDKWELSDAQIKEIA